MVPPGSASTVAHEQTLKHLLGGADVLRWKRGLDIEANLVGPRIGLMSGNPTTRPLSPDLETISVVNKGIVTVGAHPHAKSP
jgi:hypothetical protein